MDKSTADRDKTGMQRDARGRFVKGGNGSVAGKLGGRPSLPAELRSLAKAAPERLTDMVQDASIPATTRADILKWAMEMVYGRPRQQVDMDSTVQATAVVAPARLDEMEDIIKLIRGGGDL